MFNDDWDSVNGNSSRDQMLAEIENLDIVVLSERLKAMKKCESYMDSYTTDRKREKENLSKTDEEKDQIKDKVLNFFSTKKLSEDKEEQLKANVYKWKNMKNDSGIIKAITYRVEELEYDENDDKSRAMVVNTLSKLVEIVFESESLEDLRDCVVEKVNELNFVDLMMFRQSCEKYYIFRVDEFNELLQDKIPYFSEEELYYYNTRMEDNGDGNNPNIVEIKENRMRELNSRILTNTYSNETYGNAISRDRISLPWRSLSKVCNSSETLYNEAEIEEAYLNNYIDVKNGIERDISFIKDIISLDKCKDIQLINIINNLNKKEIYKETNEDENENEEYKAELNKKKYLIGYLKNRILNMNPIMVSMLEVTENGEFNKHIETVMEQQNFVEDKDFSDR